MTTRDVLLWIHVHLVPTIEQAIEQSKKKNPSLLYTPDWLVGITYRESSIKILKYASNNTPPELMHSIIKGDFIMRKGEKQAQYHGFGYTQIDINSYPDFIISGDWKIPLKLYLFTIKVLEEKRKFIESKIPKLGGDDLHRAITAAYNCGQGNVLKALTTDRDVDYFTTGQDYSKDVWQRRAFYKQIVTELNN